MENRKVFKESILPLPKENKVSPVGLMLQPTITEHLSEQIPVVFAMKIPAKAQRELEQRVSSGQKIMSINEQGVAYSPKKEDIDALVSWLKQENFTITKLSRSGTSVYAKASIEQIQKSLRVTMVRVTKDGFTYSAAQNAPSLPADIGQNVSAIIGLQPFRQLKKHLLMRVPKHGNRIASSAANVTGVVPSPAISNAPPYLASEILNAYNANGVGATGKGQTIAILIDTFPNDADLIAFWQKNGLNTTMAQVTKINVTGQNLPLPSGEETLDAEWTTGIAPDANLRIYASGSLQFADLDMALDQIIEDVENFPDMRQLSISLGLGEKYMSKAEVNTQHLKFLKLSAAGVNVFVSSGDAGSNPDSTGHSPSGPLQVEHPSSDPFVVGVGGTTLKLSAAGTVNDESGWAGGGGGKSILFKTKPVWQTGVGISANNPRLVPDVSLTANPDYGAYLFINGGIMQIGGTSWSAPAWAGFCAIINEARIKAGKDALTFLNPLLYPLLGTPCFRDIQTGSNGRYNAQPGYDMVTGLGVPNIQKLINTLP